MAYTTYNIDTLTVSGSRNLSSYSRNDLTTGDRAIGGVVGDFLYFEYCATATGTENTSIRPYTVRPDDYSTGGNWVEQATAPSASDVTYGTTWSGVTEVAPSKNVVYEKIEILNGEIEALVNDTVYDDTWDGITDTAPSKNAVYDEIEILKMELLYAGYIMGGYTSANTNAIEDLIFNDETSQAISATLNVAKYGGTGVQYGYR